jgi:hypothetical protein
LWNRDGGVSQNSGQNFRPEFLQGFGPAARFDQTRIPAFAWAQNGHFPWRQTPGRHVASGRRHGTGLLILIQMLAGILQAINGELDDHAR